MGNDFDCNINNNAVNKINKIQTEKTEADENIPCEQEYKEGSSLNLAPSAIAGRSVVDVKLPSKIMSREEFENLARTKLKENLDDTESCDFISELLADIEPQEQENFIKWVDYCNKYAKYVKQVYSSFENDNDDLMIVENFKSFADNPVLRTNTDDCIALLEKYKKEVNQYVETPNKSISKLVEYYIKDKTPKDICNHLKACDLLTDRFYQSYLSWVGAMRKAEPELSCFRDIEPETLLRLSPLAKIFKLDIDGVRKLSQSPIKEKLLSDEHLKKVADVISHINYNSQNLDLLKKLTTELVSSDGEHFDMCCKGFHYFNNPEIPIIHKVTLIDGILNKIFFADREKLGTNDVKLCGLFRELSNNTEVLDAIKNVEIDISNGISFSKIKKDSEEYETNRNYFQKIPPLYLFEYILMTSNRLDDEKSFFIDNQNSYIHSVNDCLLEILALNSKEEIFEQLKKIEQMKAKTKKRPELYLNGNEQNRYLIDTKVADFYENNSLQLFRLVSTLDKEAVDVLMRKRDKEFREYLKYISTFSSMELYLLKKLSNCVNVDGKPFLPTQKAEFIDLIMGYKNNNLSKEKLFEMAETGKADLPNLKLSLFNQIMKNAGMTDEEISATPKEKLLAWNTKYAPLLAKGYLETNEYLEVNEKGYNDIIRASNLYDFEEYINDEANVYGKANAKTKQLYKDLNLDYEKWVHPSKDLEVDFVSKDKNKEQLKQIIAQIEEDMNTLMKTPVKGHIKKQYPEFVSGDKFVIPKEYETSKAKTLKFVKSLVLLSDEGKMAPVWKRAIKNIKEGNPDKKEIAQATETIYQHLHQRIDDLENVSDVKIEKNLNWKIKMWDRIPQKDLFQGNYSTCCIGIGNGNGHAVPHYLMNTAFNMIEIVDNETDTTIGNALCYFVKTNDGKPAFVIDNIEINNSEKTSTEIGKALREKIFQYASNIAEAVTGREDTPVFLSDQYNDVPYEDLPSHDEVITFLGDIDCENIYMDMFSAPASWTSKDNFTQVRRVLTLK